MAFRTISTVVVSTVTLAALAGCGASQPPKEILDARAAYQRAQAGPAAQLDPTAVHEAKSALDTAEQANADDPSSEKTRDLGYVAMRRAELAEVNASIVTDSRERDADISKSNALTQSDLSQSNAQLAATRQDLATEKQQLATTEGALAQEKAAREASEKRLKETMDKLAIAASVAVKDEPRGTVITIPGSVLFATNQTVLLPAAQAKLSQVADSLKDQPDNKIIVEGHTDSQGTEASNMDLSQRRAQSVRDFLVSKGVPTDKITAQGIGMDRPVADNSSVEGRAQNRRVEIIVQPIEKR
jgi:outer membrane protein OmpA-like peptidoglycan-associated protein